MDAETDQKQTGHRQRSTRPEPAAFHEVPGEAAADAAHDAFRENAWPQGFLRGGARPSPARMASVLSGADGGTWARFVSRLQQQHGNAYVQRVVAEWRGEPHRWTGRSQENDVTITPPPEPAVQEGKPVGAYHQSQRQESSPHLLARQETNGQTAVQRQQRDQDAGPSERGAGGTVMSQWAVRTGPEPLPGVPPTGYAGPRESYTEADRTAMQELLTRRCAGNAERLERFFQAQFDAWTEIIAQGALQPAGLSLAVNTTVAVLLGAIGFAGVAGGVVSLIADLIFNVVGDAIQESDLAVRRSTLRNLLRVPTAADSNQETDRGRIARLVVDTASYTAWLQSANVQDLHLFRIPLEFPAVDPLRVKVEILRQCLGQSTAAEESGGVLSAPMAPVTGAGGQIETELGPAEGVDRAVWETMLREEGALSERLGESSIVNRVGGRLGRMVALAWLTSHGLRPDEGMMASDAFERGFMLCDLVDAGQFSRGSYLLALHAGIPEGSGEMGHLRVRVEWIWGMPQRVPTDFRIVEVWDQSTGQELWGPHRRQPAGAEGGSH
ncbi:MAG: hypothetical protein M1570_00220 [Chloroflexi bacterium]|nr:hypothetical protein [Chloroflexota bacterium]